jgi:plastocyanin
MDMGRVMMVACAMVVLGACSNGGSGGTDAGGAGDTGAADTGGAGDTGAADTGAMADSGPGPLNGCAETAFIDLRAGGPDSRMIMVPRGTNTFDMPCITISAGQAVEFMWDFALHPLAAGPVPGTTGGAASTPIQPQTTGALYTVTFPDAGDYPFYCATHYATGMAGVVRVVP